MGTRSSSWGVTRVIGAIALHDEIRPTAAAAVSELRQLGLRCVLLTGDNETVAHSVAAEIAVEEVVACALPADKVDLIRTLQAQGHSVAMIGDGINDGPAIASADLGLAVGSGTDVARNAADLIVVRDDLRMVSGCRRPGQADPAHDPRQSRLGLRVQRGRDTLAALGLLNPLISGAAMAMSSAFVVWNSAYRSGDPSASATPLRRGATRYRPGHGCDTGCGRTRSRGTGENLTEGVNQLAKVRVGEAMRPAQKGPGRAILTQSSTGTSRVAAGLRFAPCPRSPSAPL